MTKFVTLESLKAEFLANPEVKASYDAMDNEFALANALISARAEAKLSQQEVAERMQTTQSAVARMESGRHAPSMTSLGKYATAVGRTIRIEIHPSPSSTVASEGGERRKA